MDLQPGDIEDVDSGFCIVVHVAPLNLDDRVNAEHMRQQLWAPAMAAAMEAHQPPVC